MLLFIIGYYVIVLNTIDYYVRGLFTHFYVQTQKF